MGVKAFIKAFLGLFWSILMVFFVKFLGIKILSLIMTKWGFDWVVCKNDKF